MTIISDYGKIHFVPRLPTWSRRPPEERIISVRFWVEALTFSPGLAQLILRRHNLNNLFHRKKFKITDKTIEIIIAEIKGI